MESTVHPDKKLTAATLSSESISSTGLIITPPPIPQIAPIMLADRLTIKKANIHSPPF